jgi:hypothetical protein
MKIKNKTSEAGIEMSLTEFVTLLLVLLALIFILFPIISIFLRLNYDSQTQSAKLLLERIDNTIYTLGQENYLSKQDLPVKKGFYYLIDYNWEYSSTLEYGNGQLCILTGDKSICKSVKNKEYFEALKTKIVSLECDKNSIDNNDRIKYCFLHFALCDDASGGNKYLQLEVITKKSEYDDLITNNNHCS